MSNHVSEWLNAYFDGELTGKLLHQVEDHLAECEACQVHNNHCTVSQPETQGFTFDGFFAEYALIDYHGAMVLPQEIDVKTASPLFCAGCTCT